MEMEIFIHEEKVSLEEFSYNFATMYETKFELKTCGSTINKILKTWWFEWLKVHE
jgi:hypothetical protein